MPHTSGQSTKSGVDCDKSKSDCQEDETSSVPECAVCLRDCIHPARLPCKHVFCFLCVKGVANQSKRCPMCRQEIPEGFLEHPQLLPIDHSQQTEASAVDADIVTDDEYLWFYEGMNGWWQYDERTNAELETAYKEGKQSCELFIAGFLYIADFTTMSQIRRNDHSRKRRIKRDICKAPKKGIAGLRLDDLAAYDHSTQQREQSKNSNQSAECAKNPEDRQSTSSSSSSSLSTDQVLSIENTAGSSGLSSAPTNATRVDRHIERLENIMHQIISHHPGYIRRRPRQLINRKRNVYIFLC